ncbi:MAG TPA: hypothetical protein PL045_05795, partial [Chitinophagaceae bacterium]|nr:hypothetical protein [Chitinophagaceae bacterium]
MKINPLKFLFMKRPTTFLKTIAIISMFCFSCHKAFDIQMKASAYAVNNSASGILNYDTATKHGIIPNDTMPDSDSIQALINSVSQNTEIFFPAGTYRINRPVSLARFRNSINLKGESGTVWKFDNSAAYNKIYNLRVGMLNIAANYNEIDNICFDQNFRDSDSADGNNALIACIIIGSWPSGSNTKTNQPTTGTTIKNCTINDYYGDAISVYNSSAKDLTITGNILRSAYIIEGWHTAGTRGEQGINVHGGSNV